MTSQLSVEQANAFLAAAFSSHDDRSRIIEMQVDRAVSQLTVNDSHLRPGGYVSGPTQMGMADMVAYMAIMTRLGEQPMAVTSNLNINFLRPCIGNVVIADGRLMKLGRSLAIVEVDIRIKDNDQSASHAIVTYALPKTGSAQPNVR
jgi:uncharacterized protein (TIGR00369 family)